MAFFDDVFWKLLNDLPASVLFPTANNRFSVSAIFFGVRLMLQLGICSEFRLYLFLFIMRDTSILNITWMRKSSWIIILLSTFIYLSLDSNHHTTFIHCISGFDLEQGSTFFLLLFFYLFIHLFIYHKVLKEEYSFKSFIKHEK